MGSKRFFFFATQDDLKMVLKQIESNIEIKYILDKVQTTPIPEVFESFAYIENIGINYTGEARSNVYMIMLKEDAILYRGFNPHPDGTQYFSIVEQDMNCDSIIFSPGGIYKDAYLIEGEVCTLSDTPKSMLLFKEFKKVFTKLFKNVHGFRVSNGVYEIKERVRLITINVNALEQYDLKI